MHSCTVLPVNEALAWYENADRGQTTVPGTTLPVATSIFGAEPMLGRLVAGADVPFAPNWHAGPRLHRLIPLEDHPPAVSNLLAGEQSSERQRTARLWLADRVHFDLLAYDDWLGGIALLAPNPIVRQFRSSVTGRQPDGGETVRVFAPPRQGISTDSLSVRVREMRFGASTTAHSVGVDLYGRAEVWLPEPVEDVVVELECERRGLLAIEGPYGFVRKIGGTIDHISPGAVIEVPGPRQGGRSTKYQRQSRSSQAFEVCDDELPAARQRLVKLRERRRRRRGEAAPDAVWTRGALDEICFYDDREAAADFIRQLVWRARRDVILVDPFFDHVALRDFALATSSNDVKVRVLLGRDHLKNSGESEQPLGERLFAEIEQLRRRSAAYRLPIPDLRLMGVDCRKYHDRFLLIDTEIWHCGHSFNQVGRNEVSMATRLRHPEAIRDAMLADFDQAEVFEKVWLQSKLQSNGETGGVLSATVKFWQAWFDAWLNLLPHGRPGGEKTR